MITSWTLKNVDMRTVISVPRSCVLKCYLCKFVKQRYVYSDEKQNLTYAAAFLGNSTA